MKSKAKVSNVSKQDLQHALPDLHYTAIVTLPVIDAVLLCLGLLDIYDANFALPPRRNGQKLYVRAASSFPNQLFANFIRSDAELFADLMAHYSQLRKAKQNPDNKKVTFTSFKTLPGELWFPLDCIIGSIVPRTVGKSPREWHITSPQLLKSFYSIPSRGGFYFLRELINQSESKEQSNGNL